MKEKKLNRKRIRRVLSLVLCLVMSLSLMPITASAELPPPIDKVEVTAPNMPDPIALCNRSTSIDYLLSGASVKASYISIDLDGCELTKWMKDENGNEKWVAIRYSNASEAAYGIRSWQKYQSVFDEGKYRLEIKLVSDGSGLFTNGLKPTATMNGFSANAGTGNSVDKVCIFRYEFTIQHKPSDVQNGSDATQHWAGFCSNCNKRINVSNHTFITIIDKPATASVAGSKHEECSVCGYKKSSVVIPRHIHEYAGGLGFYSQQSDSDYHWRYCSTCHEQEKSKHTFDLGKITKQPTTIEEGEKVYTCTACQRVKKEKVPKLGDPVKTVLHESGTVLAIEDSIFSVKVKAESVEYRMPLGNSVSVSIPATVAIDGVNYKVTAIADGAFKNNTNITSVEIGSNVTSIGEDAFSGCKKLNRVVMGSKVTKIGDKAFYKCTALTKITIPAKVSKIGKQAFYGCKKLKTITIKTSKLTTKKVGSKAFTNIHKKATVKVPKKKLKAYKTMLKKRGISKKTQKIKN